ncbi:Ferric siderophore transport system periplasmic binding protein TonB [Paramagnetospirillum magnetotacticum MS-1]|uniref:Ferric siderophore transport system periplasmic binding protein TonB n=1 Tax=Paramagnetospirillum magnetotacticum MS-1 TaxID=272627 RepID=A0A0C2YWD5_PARME|nr:energy transducer TonB [Paramagnetospirillum magnetotacticum]KIL99438.1 Ferric siderophore transport system periplasmic binding protein TonB [Paramagnetospirillum magnetotacticum MS-1]
MFTMGSLGLGSPRGFGGPASTGIAALAHLVLAGLLMMGFETAERPKPPAASMIEVRFTAPPRPVPPQAPQAVPQKPLPPPPPKAPAAKVVKAPSPPVPTVTLPVAEAAPASPAAPAASVVAEPAPSPVVEARFDAAYLNNPKPPYPVASRRMGEVGTVFLRVLVSENGKAIEVMLKRSSGSARLDQSALETVRTWSFQPAHRGGTPLQSWVVVPIEFNLN